MEYHGYIKLHRKILENKIFYKPNYLAIFMEILLNVYHSPYKKAIRGDIIDLKPGEGIFFQKEISDKFNISLGTVSNILKFLKTENIIEIKPTTKYSIIKLNNWSKYQTSENETENELKTEGKPTENELKHYKNVNNVENVNNDISKDTETKVSDAPKQYGNKDINATLLFLMENIGISDFKESKEKQRQFGKHIFNLGKKIGKEDFLKRFNGILSDGFKKKNCNSIQYLYGELKSYITNENLGIVSI